MFADAEIIVGLHGPGPANMAFAKPQVRVIEFLPAAGPDESNPSMALYHDFAKAAGIRYFSSFQNPTIQATRFLKSATFAWMPLL